MARETQAFAKCPHCGGGIAVKRNVSDKAYFNCDHCGFAGVHKWQRTSDAYMALIAPPPAPAPAAPAKPTKPGQPAPAASAAPAQPESLKSPRSHGTLLG